MELLPRHRRTLSFGGAYIEFVDAGSDKVLGHQRHEARGRTSGADVAVDYWLVTTLREGKILRDEKRLFPSHL